MANEILIPEEILAENPELVTEQEVTEKVSEVEGNASSEKTVPLSALHKEREEKRRYKEEAQKFRTIVDRLLNSTGAKNIDQFLSHLDQAEIRKKMAQNGVGSDAAREWLRIEEENRNLRKNEAVQKSERDIQELSANPLYSDILDVRDTVLEFARDKGISVKEAYNALFAEERTSRLQKEAREAALADREIKDKKKIPALAAAGSGSKGGSINLTQKELEIAKAAGITPQEYAKFKK